MYVESDQKGPLIYALNLTEKGLQILSCEESDQTTYLLTYFFGLRFFSSEVEIFSGGGGGLRNFRGRGLRFFFWGGG